MLHPAKSNTPPTGLVLSGVGVTCVVNLMDRILFDLILSCSDRELSLPLLALSPSPFPRVTMALLPLPGSVLTVTRARVAFSRPAWTLLSSMIMMGPRMPVNIG